eukprot:5460923-Pyramimonas_sp.AAC.1
MFGIPIDSVGATACRASLTGDLTGSYREGGEYPYTRIPVHPYARTGDLTGSYRESSSQPMNSETKQRGIGPVQVILYGADQQPWAKTAEALRLGLK